MKYLSVCSGIEAATVAWHPLGWEPVTFADLENRCADLERRVRFKNLNRRDDL